MRERCECVFVCFMLVYKCVSIWVCISVKLNVLVRVSVSMCVDDCECEWVWLCVDVRDYRWVWISEIMCECALVWVMCARVRLWVWISVLCECERLWVCDYVYLSMYVSVYCIYIKVMFCVRFCNCYDLLDFNRVFNFLLDIKKMNFIFWGYCV